MSKKKKKRAKGKRKAKRCRKLQARKNRPIIKRRPKLREGMLVQLVEDPANDLGSNEWGFFPGIKTWSAKHEAEELFPAFSSKIQWRHENDTIKTQARKDIYNSVVLLVKIEKTAFADLCQILIDDRAWWILRKDIKGEYNG